MASSSFLPKLLLLCFCLIYFISSSPLVQAQIEETSLGLISDTLDWPSTMSLYEEEFGDELGDDDVDELGDDDVSGGKIDRRSLFWRRMHYFISYGALSANRVPCPPRSGRSYYTHNCHRARGPVHPYSRGCSRITLCRR